MKRFFNILILFVVTVFFTGTVYAKDIKFIQVTDLHYNSTQTATAHFLKLIDLINNTPNLDFVAFTGDNIDVANKNMLEDFLNLAKKIKVPYYIEVGNHDCFKSGGLSKKTYRKMVNKSLKRHYKDFNFVVKKNDVIFIYLDGTKEVIPSANGYFKAETLQWLEKQLKKNKNKKVVIFQHFPMSIQRPGSNHNLFRPEAYERIISENKNIMAIFAGHYHSPSEEEKDNVLYVVTGAGHGADAGYREVYIEDLGHNNYEIYSQMINFTK